MGYLLAVNIETLVLAVGAMWVGDYLNDYYPVSFSWYWITVLLAIVVIAHSWYAFFRFVIVEDKSHSRK